MVVAGILEAIRIQILLTYMTLVEAIADGFNVSENADSIFILEEDKFYSSYATFNFSAMFELYDTLMMTAER